MARVLVTAFGPYAQWKTNSSWLAMVELTQKLPVLPDVTTRLYPVDFLVVRAKLETDLRDGYDYVLHLGQAPGAASLHLESIALNVGTSTGDHPDTHHVLVPGAPVAFQSSLPLADWAFRLRQAGIACRVSFHAGTYLCNAIFYLTHFLCAKYGLQSNAAFVHIPLAPTQTYDTREDAPSMPSETVAGALRLILDQLTTDSRL